MKRCIHLTVERDVLQAARPLARVRHGWLSSVVEGELRRIVNNAGELTDAGADVGTAIFQK